MKELTITADGGGSNGARVRLWKVELQKLADATNLTLSVHHYQGNRVKELWGEQACEELVVPGGDFAL
jgi:hypothetical protein